MDSEHEETSTGALLWIMWFVLLIAFIGPVVTFHASFEHHSTISPDVRVEHICKPSH